MTKRPELHDVLLFTVARNGLGRNSKAVLLNHIIIHVSEIIGLHFSVSKKNGNFLNKWNCATMTVPLGVLYVVSQSVTQLHIQE